jgi:hypothetical protein
MQISHLSPGQYVHSEVRRTIGRALNTADGGDTVKGCLIAEGSAPVEADWRVASWETTLDGRTFARLFVQAPPPGPKVLWWRVSASPEDVVLEAGRVTVA